jgi:hypothetical protein
MGATSESMFELAALELQEEYLEYQNEGGEMDFDEWCESRSRDMRLSEED